MTHRRQQHSAAYAKSIGEYAEQSGWHLKRYSEYHYRLFAGILTLDFWTSGKYYVLNDETEAKHIRGGEKGQLPRSHDEIFSFLTKLIFAGDSEAAA